jgi:16S rRNA (cytidine1402-2'-O)-methyltransferase
MRFTCQGHPYNSGTHATTLERTRALAIGPRATCIVGVGANYDADALLKLRGEIEVVLEGNGVSDSFTATVSPFFLGGDSLVFRRGLGLRTRTFAYDATKTAADLDRKLMHADSVFVSMRATGQQAVGALFVVSLPIGNDDDLSPRAARVLQHADVVLAEDTRRVHALAQRLGMRTAPTLSYHDRNENERVVEVVERIAAGERVALVSDAGTPLLSDPGYVVVRETIARDLPVSPVPGPSAALAVAAVSGLPVHEILFAGFLPRTTAKRQSELQRLFTSGATVVCYEAPNRVASLLSDIDAVAPGTRVCIGREVTKDFEEFAHGTPAELAARFTAEDARGEFTIVLAPPAPDAADTTADDELLRALLAEGVPPKTLARALARTPGVSRNAAYERVLGLQE